jgi:hypothetical protein
MLHYKSKLSIYILKLLKIVQLVLRKLRDHALPPQNYINPEDMFHKEEHMDSYKHFKKYFYKALFKKKYELQKYSIRKSIENLQNYETESLLFLEFGVFSGTSINIFSKELENKKIYGFDSFEGINEDWFGTSKEKGTFSMHGKLPKVSSNVDLIKGLVQETLPEFLKNNDTKKIAFMHMDLDVYASSKYVLEKAKPYLIKGSVILFDELYNFPGWSEGEYKALKETFNDNEYKFIAFSSNGSGVAIQII